VPFIAQQIQQAIYPQLEQGIHTESPDFTSWGGGLVDSEAPASPPVQTASKIPGLETSPTPLDRKLDQIVIPSLVLSEATIREAINFLVQKSRELDTQTDGAQPRGVSYRVRAHEERADDARITVSLTNIPLREALRYVTGLGNLKFTVEADRVVVVPLGAAVGALMTKDYRIPEAVLSGRDAKAFLEEQA
jgi:general secretion pathway protein D